MVAYRRDALKQKAFLLQMGCLIGIVGIWMAILAATSDLASGSLVIWPSTLSELCSDFTTGRGRIFFGCLILAAMLVFGSWFPAELDPRNALPASQLKARFRRNTS